MFMKRAQCVSGLESWLSSSLLNRDHNPVLTLAKCSECKNKQQYEVEKHQVCCRWLFCRHTQESVCVNVLSVGADWKKLLVRCIQGNPHSAEHIVLRCNSITIGYCSKNTTTTTVTEAIKNIWKQERAQSAEAVTSSSRLTIIMIKRLIRRSTVLKWSCW